MGRPGRRASLPSQPAVRRQLGRGARQQQPELVEDGRAGGGQRAQQLQPGRQRRQRRVVGGGPRGGGLGEAVEPGPGCRKARKAGGGGGVGPAGKEEAAHVGRGGWRPANGRAEGRLVGVVGGGVVRLNQLEHQGQAARGQVPALALRAEPEAVLERKDGFGRPEHRPGYTGGGLQPRVGVRPRHGEQQPQKGACLRVVLVPVLHRQVALDPLDHVRPRAILGVELG
mmetsp:Transcript_21809/g.70465  ORF Transcript_21809/g.70465 Transcript_21809/m.70465 type:complete len:227 (-) Transcript_21809:2126-2806(-)